MCNLFIIQTIINGPAAKMVIHLFPVLKHDFAKPHAAIKMSGCHFMAASLQLKFSIRRLWRWDPLFSYSCPSTLCLLTTIPLWCLWEIQLQKQLCIFSIYLNSHTCLCLSLAWHPSLAFPLFHYLNLQFLSGFSEFNHTFNLWQNEWWLLSEKKKNWQASSLCQRISFLWRWDFPLCCCVSVWWGLNGSIGAEIGCSRDRG